ncbi:MAG: family 43 glycosylhydrolase [Candidatus Ornithomonoglobus sp.]
MKKIIGTITALCIAAGSLTPVLADTAAQVINNPDFEGIDADNNIPWWWGATTRWDNETSSNVVTSKVAAEKTEVHGGGASALITDRADANAGIMQYVALEAGQGYISSAAIKHTGSTEVKFYIKANGNGVDYTLGEGTVKPGEWSVIGGEYTLPEGFNNTYCNVYICTDSSDTEYVDFYVDDVTVTEKMTGPVGDGYKDAIGRTEGNMNPLMGYAFGADPFAMEYDGRVYVYMTADDFTTDENGNPAQNVYGQIHTIKVISSEDLINWTNHGEIPVGGQALANGAASWAYNSWAPAAAHKTIDGKEKFFLYFADNASGIGVLEADSPTGPFYDPIGGPLVTRSTPGAEGVIWMFDPAVFIDDNGEAYLYFGGGIDETWENGENKTPPENYMHPKTARVIKLGGDMTSVEGSAAEIDAPGILEDSGIHKYNNTYYYSYCTNFTVSGEDTDGMVYPTGTICYMTSDSPMGPFTYRGSVLDNMYAFFQMGGNNHHAFFDFKGKHYITYHARTLEKAMGYNDKDCRSTHINEVFYNADGTMQKVTADYAGCSIPGVTVDASKPIEAEIIAYAAEVSVERISDEGNAKVTGITNGSWTSVSNVDFGNGIYNTFTAKAVGRNGGTIKVKLDSIDSEPIAEVDVPASATDVWQDITVDIAPVTGLHDVYFVYNGVAGTELLDVDSYSFGYDAEQYKVTVSKPYMSSGKTVVAVKNPTLKGAAVNVYAVSRTESGALLSAKHERAEVAAQTYAYEIEIDAQEGDTIYVWDDNMKPYAEPFTLSSVTPAEYMEAVRLALTETEPADITEEISGTDYGTLKKYTYYSAVAERDTNVNVLLPPGYSENEKYPVLYMLHGYWGNEDSLLDGDSTLKLQQILGNLTAQGEAEKMIVVFPYIFCSKDKPVCTGLDLENTLCYDNFINDLTMSLMPYIESNFSVKTGRENTAISGFSQGGREALFIGITRSDLFGFVGGVCPAPGLTPGGDVSMHPGQLQEDELKIDKSKGEPYLLMISAAVNDSVVGNSPENYHNILIRNGEEHVWHTITDADHDGRSIRPHFYNFAKSIFKIN